MLGIIKKTCQILWERAKEFIQENVVLDANQPFIHLFSEMWRLYEMNKNYFYKNGIYAYLLKKYEIKNLTIRLKLKNYLNWFWMIINENSWRSYTNI